MLALCRVGFCGVASFGWFLLFRVVLGFGI